MTIEISRQKNEPCLMNCTLFMLETWIVELFVIYPSWRCYDIKEQQIALLPWQLIIRFWMISTYMSVIIHIDWFIRDICPCILIYSLKTSTWIICMAMECKWSTGQALNKLPPLVTHSCSDSDPNSRNTSISNRFEFIYIYLKKNSSSLKISLFKYFLLENIWLILELLLYN